MSLKSWNSSSYSREFYGNRKYAIEQVIAYFTKLLATSDIQPGRYTFRADDESGFTVRVYSTTDGFAVECVAKWNAARN